MFAQSCWTVYKHIQRDFPRKSNASALCCHSGVGATGLHFSPPHTLAWSSGEFGTLMTHQQHQHPNSSLWSVSMGCELLHIHLMGGDISFSTKGWHWTNWWPQLFWLWFLSKVLVALLVSILLASHCGKVRFYPRSAPGCSGNFSNLFCPSSLSGFAAC